MKHNGYHRYHDRLISSLKIWQKSSETASRLGQSQSESVAVLCILSLVKGMTCIPITTLKMAVMIVVSMATTWRTIRHQCIIPRVFNGLYIWWGKVEGILLSNRPCSQYLVIFLSSLCTCFPDLSVPIYISSSVVTLIVWHGFVFSLSKRILYYTCILQSPSTCIIIIIVSVYLAPGCLVCPNIPLVVVLQCCNLLPIYIYTSWRAQNNDESPWTYKFTSCTL